MQRILNSTAMQNGVHPSFLEFCGVQDETSTIGKILFLFNIEDSLHPKFKSTVAFTKKV